MIASSPVTTTPLMHPAAGIGMDVPAQPRREIRFRKIPFGERQHAHILVLRRGHQLRTVQRQQQPVADVRRALVAIEKRMVARSVKPSKSPFRAIAAGGRPGRNAGSVE